MDAVDFAHAEQHDLIAYPVERKNSIPRQGPIRWPLRKAVRGQRAVVQAYPRSLVARAFRSLARKIDALPMPMGASGQLQFFVERLIQYSTEFGEIGR